MCHRGLVSTQVISIVLGGWQLLAQVTYLERALQSSHEELGLLANDPSMDAPDLRIHLDGSIGELLISP